MHTYIHNCKDYTYAHTCSYKCMCTHATYVHSYCSIQTCIQRHICTYTDLDNQHNQFPGSTSKLMKNQHKLRLQGQINK